MNYQISFLEAHNGLEDENLYEFTVKKLEYMLGFPKKSVFQGSAFEEWSKLGPTTRGVGGERLVKCIALDVGYSVYRPKGRSIDWVINNHNVEVKTAMQCKAGYFIINQVRDQDYEYIIIPVIMPKEVHLFTVPKYVMMAHSVPQHTGNGGTETFIYANHTYDDMVRDFGKYLGVKRFIELLK